jgi:hypothetical protein
MDKYIIGGLSALVLEVMIAVIWCVVHEWKENIIEEAQSGTLHRQYYPLVERVEKLERFDASLKDAWEKYKSKGRRRRTSDHTSS